MDALNPQPQQWIAFLYDLSVLSQSLFQPGSSLDSFSLKMAARLDARVLLLLQQQGTELRLLASAGLSRVSRQQALISLTQTEPIDTHQLWQYLPYTELKNADPACLLTVTVGPQRAGYLLLMYSPNPVSTPLKGILKQLSEPLFQALEHRRLRQQNDVLLEQLKAIQNASPDGMLLIDQQGRILQANPAARRLLTAEQAALEGQLLQALLWPGARQQQQHALFLQALRQYHTNWQPEQLIALRLPDGQQRFLACSLTHVALSSPPQFTVYLHDETRQQQSALHLKETKARFEIMSEHLQAGILMESADRRVLLSNSTFVSLFDLPVTPEQMLNQDCREGLARSQDLFADPAGFITRIEQIVQTGDKVLSERLTLADGRVWERDYLPIRYDSRLLGHLWVYRDISDRAQKDFEREILARFPDESPSPVMRLDTAGQIIYCNRPAMYLMYYLHQDLDQNLNGQLLELTRQALNTQQKQVAEVAFGRIVYQLVLVPFPEQAYVNLYATDISERIQAEQAALEARDQALQASEAKSSFLATMSHEIRTPLNAILGTLDLLNHTPLNPQQQEYSGICRDAGQSLLFLINQVLDFSRLEAGKMQLSHQTFSLHGLVQKTLGFFKLQARQKDLQLKATLPEFTPDWVSGDQDRLQQILRILLDNALKFTAAGQVELEILYAVPLQDMYEICWRVQDTGIGIPTDQQSLIFDSFQQVDASRTRQYGGSGLGLSIVKNLVALFEGNIWVESEPGQGTAFYFTTRLHQASSKSVWPSSAQTETHVEAREPAVEQRPVSIAPHTFEGLRVLIAEDYPANQLLLKAYLADWPLTLHFVANGREALAAWQSFAPDLILMDLQMPEMDGIAATREIREQTPPGSRAVPIVILTADAQSATRSEALAAGADDLLLKPVTQPQVLQTLLKHLKPPSDQTSQTKSLSISEATRSDAPAPYRVILELLDIVPLFLKQRREEVPQMAEYISTQDFTALARLGHSLKGAGASFGFDYISSLGQQIEQAAEARDLLQLARFQLQLSQYLDWITQTLPAQIQAARAAG